jgi:hypothetical protein
MDEPVSRLQDEFADLQFGRTEIEEKGVALTGTPRIVEQALIDADRSSTALQRITSWSELMRKREPLYGPTASTLIRTCSTRQRPWCAPTTGSGALNDCPGTSPIQPLSDRIRADQYRRTSAILWCFSSVPGSTNTTSPPIPYTVSMTSSTASSSASGPPWPVPGRRVTPSAMRSADCR